MSLPRTLRGYARYRSHPFFVSLALVTVLALMPGPAIPDVFQFWDKAQHALAYCVLAVFGVAAYPSRRWRVAAGLLIHGALIEVLQGTLTTTRYADMTDWFADTIGVSLGVLLVLCLTPIVANRIKAWN